MALLNEWGPAILFSFTVIVGVLLPNKRTDDVGHRIDTRSDNLSHRFAMRFDDCSGRINTHRDDANFRLSDFRSHLDLLKSEIGRLEKRIESLESPLAKR